jgi:hypothetical protein
MPAFYRNCSEGNALPFRIRVFAAEHTAAQKSVARQDELPIRHSGYEAQAGGFVQLQIAVILGVGTGKVLSLAPGDIVIGSDDAANLQIRMSLYRHDVLLLTHQFLYSTRPVINSSPEVSSTSPKF